VSTSDVFLSEDGRVEAGEAIQSLNPKTDVRSVPGKPKKESAMRKFLMTVVALAIVVVMFRAGSVKAAAVKPSAQSKSGAAVAYAKVDLLAGSLLSFGGKGTTSAVISDSSVSNWVDVTFTGKYPKDVTEDQVIINATCQSDDYGVANAQVISVSSSQLVIEVYGWVSDTEESNGEKVFFTVFLGQ
jgi:hypothetical protein